MERQVSEMELIRAAYADEIDLVEEDENGNYSFRAKLHPGGVVLQVSFPNGYPRCDPRLKARIVHHGFVDWRRVQRLQIFLEERCRSSRRSCEEEEEDNDEGEEQQAFLLLQALEEELRRNGREEEEGTICPRATTTAVGKETRPQQEEEPSEEVVVTMFRFDHIKAKSARKTISLLAQQHQCVGLCRPGKPGLVVVQGREDRVRVLERDMRARLSTCTRNMGCWGPANHHFQSISVVAHRPTTTTTTSVANDPTDGPGFVEMETETLMHFAHAMRARGWLDLFWEGTRLNPSFDIPNNPGRPDPYLRPRGGTKRKKGNRMLR